MREAERDGETEQERDRQVKKKRKTEIPIGDNQVFPDKSYHQIRYLVPVM